MFCILEGLGFPGGYCSAPSCELTDPINSCVPSGGDAVCVMSGAAAVCLDQCIGDGDCRSGYTCQLAPDGVTLVCLPPP
jgi:hypothetical protein